MAARLPGDLRRPASPADRHEAMLLRERGLPQHDRRIPRTIPNSDHPELLLFSVLRGSHFEGDVPAGESGGRAELPVQGPLGAAPPSFLRLQRGHSRGHSNPLAVGRAAGRPRNEIETS